MPDLSGKVLRLCFIVWAIWFGIELWIAVNECWYWLNFCLPANDFSYDCNRLCPLAAAVELGIRPFNIVRGRSRTRQSRSQSRSRSRSERSIGRSRSRGRTSRKNRSVRRSSRSRSRSKSNRGRSRSRSQATSFRQSVGPRTISAIGYHDGRVRTQRRLGKATPRLRAGLPSGRFGILGPTHRISDTVAEDIVSYKIKSGAVIGSYCRPPKVPAGLTQCLVEAVGIYPILGKVPPGKIYGGIHLIFGDYGGEFKTAWGADGKGWTTWVKGLDESLYFDWNTIERFSKLGKPFVQHTSMRRQIDYEGDRTPWDRDKDSIGYVIDVSWHDPSIDKDVVLLTLKAKTLYSHSVKK